MSAAYKRFIQSLYRQQKLTATDVWSYVPSRLTAAEATSICGPRPNDTATEAVASQAALAEESSGTVDDPIRWVQPMLTHKGKYYSDGGALYLCTKGSRKPLAFDLADLVGLYVTEVS